MRRTIVLVRHPPVALAWHGRCYGQSDPGLSREGQRVVAGLVDKLAVLAPDAIVHSALRRTSVVADRLASATGIAPIPDERWRERCFGTWEGRRWNAIYRETGNEMDGMTTHPHQFKPGGGETTAELCSRVRRGYDALPRLDTVIIVTHGGPIAAIMARHAKAPLADLARYIPATGSVTVLSD